MYPSVTKVVAGDNYILSIDFSNGESGILDMKPYLDFGVFQKLKDPQTFAQVHISFDTIEWRSGVDLDPEFVYSKCRDKKRTESSAPADSCTARLIVYLFCPATFPCVLRRV